MKLTSKIITVVIIGVVLILAIDGYFSMAREVAFFERDMRQDARALGRAIARPVIHTWTRDGLEAALQLISEANQEEQPIQVRLVLLTEDSSPHLRPLVSLEELTGLLKGEEAQFLRNQGTDSGLYCSYLPLVSDGKLLGALEVRESLTHLEAYHSKTVRRIWFLTGSLVVLGTAYVTVLGFLLVGQPLQKLMGRVRRISAGDLSQGPPVWAFDELGELAQAIEEMRKRILMSQDMIRAESNARIAALEQLRHTDRLQTVGRLAAGIAHELGTPLQVISGRAGLITGGRLKPEQVNESSRIIKDQADRMTSIIRRLLDFARSRSPQRKPTSIQALVEQTVNLIEPLAKKREVSIERVDAAEDVVSNLDSGQIQQVLMNLIVNAIQAVPEEGTVSVEFGRTSARDPSSSGSREQPRAFIKIKDNGVGIKTDDLNQIFEPFFTTKDIGEGTGLGLSIAYGIVQEHHGWIEVQSEPANGSSFTVYLPLEAGT